MLRIAVLLLFVLVPARAENWSDFIENDFPFFSSVLDARKSPDNTFTNNLTPRGLILNLGNDLWACFDTELLRVSAIWKGKGVTPVSMSQGSYHDAGEKTPEGQYRLPKIEGEPWLRNGIYAGWQSSEDISLSDPREPGPDPREVGRGPLNTVRFKSILLNEDPPILIYEVDGVMIRERIFGSSSNSVSRKINVSPSARPLWLLLGKIQGDRTVKLVGSGTLTTDEKSGIRKVLIPASAAPSDLTVTVGNGSEANRKVRQKTPRWPERIVTSGKLSPAKGAYVLDEIELPTANPWRRNVRAADIAFRKEGAAVVTFDGDVWLVKGLRDDLKEIEWKRFTSGLHEPLAIVARGEDLFVFDRNGIWRLQDLDGDGEADVHELFSNVFTQTAETREFACGMRVAPDGSFILAKGGQESGSLGKHNGSILRVSADGQKVDVLGWGLRQPFLGVNPVSGLITASDQQGHYIPSTPLHVIGDHKYYGFIPTFLPKEKYPAEIADPLTWIPHPINASGASQIFLEGTRMGPLDHGLIHLGYYRPEIFVVLMNQRTPRLQASVLSLTRQLSFPLLSGAVNPLDGQLYVAGFQIWGTTAPKISGIARVRYTGAPSTLPREVVPMDKGILLRFHEVLDASAATNIANYSGERWNYVRTANYGSPHFKIDGTKGQDFMSISSVYLSHDGKSVFVGMPDMRKVMQMRFGWSLALKAGERFDQNAYFTPYELATFEPEKEGFDSMDVDLSAKNRASAVAAPVNAAEGQKLYELMGCVACHSIDGSTIGKVGPSWRGLIGNERLFADGSKVMADESYVRESIKEPAKRVVKGFDKSDTGMPSYDGVLTAEQIESLILFIKTLK